MITDRFVCTKENPWDSTKGDRAEHPDAKYLRDVDYGDGCCVAKYSCPNCGLTFGEEIVQ